MFKKQLNIWNYGKKELVVASDLHISIVRALLDLQANIGINDHLVIANGLQKDYLQKMQQRTGRTNRALIRLWSSHVRAYMATHSNPLQDFFIFSWPASHHKSIVPRFLPISGDLNLLALSLSPITHILLSQRCCGGHFPPMICTPTSESYCT